MKEELIALIKAGNKLSKASRKLLEAETQAIAQDRIVELKLAIVAYDEKLLNVLNKPQHATDENRG